MNTNNYKDILDSREDIIKTVDLQQDINNDLTKVIHKKNHKKILGLLLPTDGSNPIDLHYLFNNYLSKTQDWTRDIVIIILSNLESSINERLDVGIFYLIRTEVKDNNVL